MGGEAWEQHGRGTEVPGEGGRRWTATSQGSRHTWGAAFLGPTSSSTVCRDRTQPHPQARPHACPRLDQSGPHTAGHDPPPRRLA